MSSAKVILENTFVDQEIADYIGSTFYSTFWRVGLYAFMNVEILNAPYPINKKKVTIIIKISVILPFQFLSQRLVTMGEN